jgi:serine/threonine protein kinase
MEYVEGKSLDQKINGSPMKLAEMLQIASQTADALSEAHSKGIVIETSNRRTSPSQLAAR